MPSPSKSGSFVSCPTFCLIVPFTSWTFPAISFSVLGFIFFTFLNKAFVSSLARLRAGFLAHHKRDKNGYLFTSEHIPVCLLFPPRSSGRPLGRPSRAEARAQRQPRQPDYFCRSNLWRISGQNSLTILLMLAASSC